MNDESEKLKIWIRAIAILFLAVGIFFGAGMYLDYAKIKTTQKWPTVEATLLTQVVRTSKHGQADQSVRYKYIVDNKEYESSKVSPNQFTQGNNEFFKMTKPGKITVFAHYNGSNPYEAYLVVDWDPLASNSIYYAVSSLVLGIIFGAASFFLGRKKTAAGNVEA